MAAKWYAANTAEVMYEYSDLAHRISREAPEGSSVLEVAPGPGYFCMELARRGSYAITGLDISDTFVKMASDRARQAGLDIRFLQGSASHMPLQRDSFEFLLCRAAFKNFADPVGALKEMCRVLKPGGRGLIIDMRGDASRSEIDQYVDGMTLSWFNKLTTRLAFRTVLLKSAYTADQFRQMLAQTDFKRVEIAEDGIGLEVSMWK